MAGIQCRLDVPEHLPAARLTADVRHNLFLAVKEALNNVVKHAEAREVWLRLIQDGSRVTLVIEDDGHGFGGLAAAPAWSQGAVRSGPRQPGQPPGRHRRPLLDFEPAWAWDQGRIERRNRVISDPVFGGSRFFSSVARLLGCSAVPGVPCIPCVPWLDKPCIPWPSSVRGSRPALASSGQPTANCRVANTGDSRIPAGSLC